MGLRKPVAAYAVAVAGVAAALALRLSLSPVLGDRLPFSAFMIAAAWVAWYGGGGPGLVALILGGVVADLAIIPPIGALSLFQPITQVQFAAYVVVGLIAIALMDSLRKSRLRADAERDLLETTLASIGDGVITTDVDSRVTRMNLEAELMTGWSAAEAVGRPLAEVFRIFHEQSRAPVECLSPGASRADALGNIAYPVLQSRDGREFPVEENCAPIRDESGAPIGMVLIFRDIAERRLEQLTLMRSELELRDLFENATIGIHWVGPDGTILRVNGTELELLGYDREEVLGHNIAEFHADPEVIGDILDRLAQGVTLDEYPARLRSKDGSIKDVVISSNVLFDNGTFVHSRCFTRDVTERKAAEEALTKSEATLRTFYENSPACMGIVEPTADGDILHLYDNPASCRFFGAEPGTLENKLSLRDIGVDPEELKRRLAHYARSEATGQPVSFDQQFRNREGQRWLAATAAPIGRGPTGRMRFCFVAEDITERKQTADALATSEERLRLALDAGRMGVWDWNMQSNELSWTEQLEPLHGVAPGSFDGTFEAFQKLIHPEDLPEVNRAILHAIDTRSGYDVEFRNPRADGSVAWVGGKGRVLSGPDGTAARMIGIGLDITRQKRSEQTARFLADASAALAVLVDLDATLRKVASLAVPYFADWVAIDFLEANGVIRRIAMAHVDPAKMELAQELHQRYPQDLDAPQGLGNILRTGKSELVSEITDEMLVRTARDEEHLRIARELGLKSYIGVPLTVRGKTLGVITFIAAESNHYYDETDLAVAQDLSNRAAIAIENAQLYAELRNADRRKDEFLATLAHELRNPLAPVSNSLELMKREGDNIELMSQARVTIERQVSQMVRLVDDLLDVSRITRDRLELKKERVELAAVVQHAVEDVWPLAERAGHELNISLPPKPVYLHADPVRIAQVLGNLLINSCKYTRPGGQIWLTASLQGDELRLSVRDTGIGIPADMLPQVFEMFTQIDRSLERSEGGLGIGLSLVKRLIEMHGGSVEAFSDGEGLGSEFVLRLPALVETHAAALTIEWATRANGPGKRKVLVVDDNRDSAESLAMLLELEGHETLVAHDGEEAMERAESFRPEMILLDIGLPKLNGYEVCRAIRREPWGKGILMVAQTGWGQESDRRKSREEGFDDHMVKPVDHVALMKLLTSMPSSSAAISQDN